MERELALRRLELEFELEMKKLEKQQESEKLECQRRDREAERLEREAERQRLETEKDRGAEMERSERGVEMERLDREKVAEMERFVREKAAEIENMRLEMEHELKLRQLGTSRVGSDNGEEVVEGEAGEGGERPVRVRGPQWEETLAGQTKRFGKTLQHVVPKMPTDVDQTPHISKMSNTFLTFTKCLLICDLNY